MKFRFLKGLIYQIEASLGPESLNRILSILKLSRMKETNELFDTDFQ